MCDEIKPTRKHSNEHKASPPMNSLKNSTLCVAGMEIMSEAMVTKAENTIHTSETMGHEMLFWLFEKNEKCLRETDELR